MPAHKKYGEVSWTSNIAYAVGLLTTDGCLSPDGRHLEFTSNDRPLIETLRRCLGLSNRITKKRSGYTGRLTAFRVQFGNVILHRWLCTIGLMPNKSKRIKGIHIPHAFFFDFLRGHLDGDGSIKTYLDPVYPRSRRLYVIFMSASRPHLEWIRRRTKKLLGIAGFLREVPRAHTLTFAKRDSMKLLSRLYPSSNVPHLQRKFQLARRFLEVV